MSQLYREGLLFEKDARYGKTGSEFRKHKFAYEMRYNGTRRTFGVESRKCACTAYIMHPLCVCLTRAKIAISGEFNCDAQSIDRNLFTNYNNNSLTVENTIILVLQYYLYARDT